MKKHRSLLTIAIGLMVILTSCKNKTEYCPAYPQDDTDYLPVDFVGQTLRYVFDGDTMKFNVMPPEFSEKYENNLALEEVCTSHAWQRLESNSNDRILRYTMSYHSAYHSWSMDFYDNEIWVIAAIIYDIYDEIGDRRTEILPQWTSPTGTIYMDIQKSIQNKRDAEADTLYLSRQHGLVLWFSPSDGHSFTLLP